LGFPELREAWFRFHDARMQRRAIGWLRDRGLIAVADAERAIASVAPAVTSVLARWPPGRIQAVLARVKQA
jgi:hypothetical protein